MLFPVDEEGKTIWKYTTKHTHSALVIFPIIKELLIILQSVESLFNLPWPEETLQGTWFCQKLVPSLRYHLKRNKQHTHKFFCNIIIVSSFPKHQKTIFLWSFSITFIFGSGFLWVFDKPVNETKKWVRTFSSPAPSLFWFLH